MSSSQPQQPTNTISRPTNIIRREGSSSTGTGRPSLLAGLTLPHTTGSADDDEVVAPQRPRRLWKVNDTSLKPVPYFYPPLDPRCTVFVSDAPPSVVAVRIAECLRKRSVSVEYDEEAVTATCMTVDRCHFVIHLFSGSSRHHPRHGMDMNARPDFSHGVLVECMRLSGSCISFHHSCRAVLQAALSHSTGADNRKMYQTQSNEFPRLLQPPHKRKGSGMKLLTPHSKRSKTSISGPHSSIALESLERAWQLLRKDRLGPQQLAMESLISLTDPESSGIDTAMHCSLAVLGAPITGGCGEEAFLNELHQECVVKLLQDRVLPGESGVAESGSCTQSGLLSKCGASDKFDGDAEDANAATNGGDEHHGGIMRALCLRAFTNSIGLVAEHQPTLLKSILDVQSRHLVSPGFIAALLEDLAGAIRPPAVVQGTRLASVHEAALACRCLGLLGEFSESAKKQILNDSVLASLEKARAVGRSTHDVLADEADRTYTRLTEDVRSC